MSLRYDGVCGCGAVLPAGTRAAWDLTSRSVTCLACLDAHVDPVIVLNAPQQEPPAHEAVGTAGASLQREYNRRVAQREDRVRVNHPKLGGLILALTDEPQSTKAFQTGAVGERVAAGKVMKRAGDDVLYLLNRSLGLGRRDGDIDLLAVGPSAIYVVDVKRYAGATVEVRRSGGLLRSAREQLFVGGRDRSALLASLHRQVEAVRAAVAGQAGCIDAEVRAAFCFVDARLPLLSTPRISGVPVLRPKGTARLVATPGPLTASDRAAIHTYLARQLPAAR